MIPEDIYSKVSPVAKAYGVPDYVWGSIAKMESNFNPRALGDSGRSFGLFQLFTGGGQGDAFKNNPTVLYDPALNAEVAMPAISKAYKLAKAQGMEDGPELAAWVAGHSGHPGYKGASNDIAKRAMDNVAKTAQKFLGLDENWKIVKTPSEQAAQEQGEKSFFQLVKDFFTVARDEEARRGFYAKLALVAAGLLFTYLGIILIADPRGE